MIHCWEIDDKTGNARQDASTKLPFCDVTMERRELAGPNTKTYAYRITRDSPLPWYESDAQMVSNA
ncbi:hypothetical protein BN2475_580012 [Paraburkholderia ribeironis]|uniref:Uncharacterized protein n=1 Tax=Paraburkholderia ribeironis TaxID=1247936 RepID=A0A1N7SE17_9BURK|nr:hypothetical protein BN2475_580012 [Paraburkholderia ribeironis]